MAGVTHPGRPVSSAAIGQAVAKALGKALVLPATGLAWLGAAALVEAHGLFDPTPPSAWTLATSWSFDPTVAIPLAAVAVGWLWLVDRIDGRHPHNPVPMARTVSFLLGLVAVAVALQSGIERYDTALFSVHMVQHLLLTLVAPPLLLLGAPITQLLRGASPWVRRRVLLPILHSGVVAAISHPVTAWILFTAVMWGSHFSPLFDLSLESPPVHQLEHLLYISTALLFWNPVIGADPAPRRLGYPARIMYLLTQMPPSSFLAMSILFAGAPLYHHYATEGSPYGIDALSDQQAAAGIMWIASDVVFIGAILLVVGAWMRHEERRTTETEARVDLERAALAARADRLAAARGTAAVATPAGLSPQPGSGEASSSR
jgi:putative membrane protein